VEMANEKEEKKRTTKHRKFGVWEAGAHGAHLSFEGQ